MAVKVTQGQAELRNDPSQTTQRTLPVFGPMMAGPRTNRPHKFIQLKQHPDSQHRRLEVATPARSDLALLLQLMPQPARKLTGDCRKATWLMPSERVVGVGSFFPANQVLHLRWVS